MLPAYDFLSLPILAGAKMHRTEAVGANPRVGHPCMGVEVYDPPHTKRAEDWSTMVVQVSDTAQKRGWPAIRSGRQTSYTMIGSSAVPAGVSPS